MTATLRHNNIKFILSHTEIEINSKCKLRGLLLLTIFNLNIIDSARSRRNDERFNFKVGQNTNSV